MSKQRSVRLALRFSCLWAFLMVVAVSPRAGGQQAPQGPGAPCADPCPPQVARNPGQHWYPDPADPAAFVDRRPTAVIGLYNGSYWSNSRGLSPQWWAGTESGCADTARDQWSGYDVPTFQFTSFGANSRPDQF